MGKITRFVGMDVHAETIAVAVVDQRATRIYAESWSRPLTTTATVRGSTNGRNSWSKR